MRYEIERKWLVNDKVVPKDLFQSPFFRIDQGYLEVLDSENDEARIRRKGDKYFLTLKKGEGIKREENEVEIPSETYNLFLSLPNLNKLEKIRYEIPDRKYTIELDIYVGNLEGLATAEVEFENILESQSYIPPEWFGREITGDKRYKNKNLAMNGLPED